jgi:hypothetical protein
MPSNGQQESAKTIVSPQVFSQPVSSTERGFTNMKHGGADDTGEDRTLESHSQWQSGCRDWSGTRNWARSSGSLGA